MSDSPLAAQLLDIIASERQRQGVSWGQMARRTGMSPSHCQHVVNRRRDSSPNIATIEKLLNALGLEIVVVPRSTPTERGSS